MNTVNIEPSFAPLTASVAAAHNSVLPRANEVEVVEFLPNKPHRHYSKRFGNSDRYLLVVKPEIHQLFDAPSEVYEPGKFNSRFAPVYGTYMVHAEMLLSITEFTESACAKPMPWQEPTNVNRNVELKAYGQFRSFFINETAGNYENFFDMFCVSTASPFYAKSRTPQFYSDHGNCSETTFSAAVLNKDYELYRPFVVENRGYTRSYFYGMAW
jgi:hypothetical protein